MASWLRNVKANTDVSKLKAPSLEDFLFTDEQTYVEDVGAFLLESGHEYSVLNVDFVKELLILVKTAEGVDIKSKPFLYEAQRRNAVQLLCIPFDDLDKVEQVITPKTSHVTNIFLYSTGRCGSTLLCKALEQLSTVQAISEPDVFGSVAITSNEEYFKEVYPGAKQPSRETVVRIARISTCLLNNFFLLHAPEQSTICYKFRSQVVEGAEIFQEALPATKNIYLYRNCFEFTEGWTRVNVQNSYTKFWFLTRFALDARHMRHFFGSESFLYKYIFGNSPGYANAPFRRGFLWCYGFMWWKNIEKALTLTKDDPSSFFHAVLRYEDLTVRKEELVLSVAKALGVAGTNEQEELSAIAEAFRSNSQAGSGIESKRNVGDASDVWFGEKEKRHINSILEYLGKKVKTGDFAFPGTI